MYICYTIAYFVITGRMSYKTALCNSYCLLIHMQPALGKATLCAHAQFHPILTPFWTHQNALLLALLHLVTWHVRTMVSWSAATL